MEAKAILTAMADLFESHPERLTHGALARDANNNAVDVMADDAFSFTINGFLERSMAEGLINGATFAAAFEHVRGVVFGRFANSDVVGMGDRDEPGLVVSVLREAAK